jgi:hypothetical protein
VARPEQQQQQQGGDAAAGTSSQGAARATGGTGLGLSHHPSKAELPFLPAAWVTEHANTKKCKVLRRLQQGAYQAGDQLGRHVKAFDVDCGDDTASFDVGQVSSSAMFTAVRE